LTSTTNITTNTSLSWPNYIGCFFGARAFQGGMSACQAQAENPFGKPSNQAESGFWYSSSTLMSGDMCAKSCSKYGFMYAAIEA
jgi:hypothetical protein